MPPPYTRDIMDLLDVPKRSAIRYVHELQDAGVPIEHEGEGSARRAVLPQEFVRPTGFVFAQGDAFALHIARAGIPHLDDTVVDEWLGELVDKLELVETKTTADRRHRFEQRFVHIADPYRPYAPHTDVLEALIDALLRSHTLQLVYRGRTRQDEPIVQPLALIMFHRNLYLLADVVDGPQRRRFSVDCILAATRTGHFDYPADFDPRVEFAHSYGIFAPEHEVEEVRLRFHARAADGVRVRQFHPTQRLEDRDDGRIDLVLQATGRELVSLALEYGPMVEVVSPRWLRDEVRRQLRQALEQYDD